MWKNGIYGQFSVDAWEEPEGNADHANGGILGEPALPPPMLGGVHRAPLGGNDDPQEVYDRLPRTDDIFNLKYSDLELRDELG